MKTNLHKTYYLLAIIDVITIIITLILAYSIYQTYEKSFQVNDQWMERSINYDQLTNLAIEANGPGNDVFDSRDVNKESKNLATLNTEIDRLTTKLKYDAQKSLNAYPEIQKRIDNFSTYLSQTNALTYQIFALIQKKQLSEASEIMANMDSKFHAALLEISKLRNKVRSIQKEQLLLYHHKATSIFYKEFYVAGFILFLVGLILFFGRKIKNSVERMLREIETRNNKLSDSEEKLTSVLNIGLWIKARRRLFFPVEGCF